LSIKLGPRLGWHRHGARDNGAPGCGPSWSFAFGSHGFCDALPIALNLSRLRSARMDFVRPSVAGSLHYFGGFRASRHIENIRNVVQSFCIF
jgi:hypothetical protein